MAVVPLKGGLSAYTRAILQAHRDWFRNVVDDAKRHHLAAQEGDVGTVPWHEAAASWRPPVVAMYRARFCRVRVLSQEGHWTPREVASDLTPFEPDAPRAKESFVDDPVMLREDAGGLYLEVRDRKGDGRIVRNPREIEDLLRRHRPALMTELEREIAVTLGGYPAGDYNILLTPGMRPPAAAAGHIEHRPPARRRWRGPAPHNVARALVADGLKEDDILGERETARVLIAWEGSMRAPWIDPAAGGQESMLRAISRVRDGPWLEELATIRHTAATLFAEL